MSEDPLISRETHVNCRLRSDLIFDTHRPIPEYFKEIDAFEFTKRGRFVLRSVAIC
jgi:hypothetical protein